MKRSAWYNDALALTMSSAGLIDKRIRGAIADCNPLRLELLREALAIESRSVGTRIEVCNRLKDEIYRQERLIKAAA